MITWFCPSCFAEVAPHDDRCEACGARIPVRDDYEDGLIAALRRHRLEDRRVLAASILGRRRCERAVPHLIEVARDDPDPYVAAEAVRALCLIGGAEAAATVRSLTEAPAFMVRRAAQECLRILQGEAPDAAGGDDE